jgi:hypothetical protein
LIDWSGLFSFFPRSRRILWRGKELDPFLLPNRRAGLDPLGEPVTLELRERERKGQSVKGEKLFKSNNRKKNTKTIATKQSIACAWEAPLPVHPGELRPAVGRDELVHGAHGALEPGLARMPPQRCGPLRGITEKHNAPGRLRVHRGHARAQLRRRIASSHSPEKKKKKKG